MIKARFVLALHNLGIKSLYQLFYKRDLTTAPNVQSHFSGHMSFPRCLVMAFLSQLPFQRLLVLAVLSWLSCHSFPFIVFLSQFSFIGVLTQIIDIWFGISIFILKDSQVNVILLVLRYLDFSRQIWKLCKFSSKLKMMNWRKSMRHNTRIHLKKKHCSQSF